MGFMTMGLVHHDDCIKWKYFLRYWPFVRGIYRSPVNSRTKDSDAELNIFSLIYAWINGRVNNHEAGDLRRYRAHYDLTVLYMHNPIAVVYNSVFYFQHRRFWVFTEISELLEENPGNISLTIDLITRKSYCILAQFCRRVWHVVSGSQVL